MNPRLVIAAIYLYRIRYPRSQMHQISFRDDGVLIDNIIFKTEELVQAVDLMSIK